MGRDAILFTQLRIRRVTERLSYYSYSSLLHNADLYAELIVLRKYVLYARTYGILDQFKYTSCSVEIVQALKTVV